MSSSLRLALVFYILLLVGCKPAAPSRAIERLALLPLVNLSGDRSLDWLSRGAQVALNRQLAPARTVSASASSEIAEAALGRATRLLHTSVDQRAGKLRIEAVLEDAVTHRQVGERIELKVPPEQVLAGLNQLARLLAKDASAPPTQKPGALTAYVEAQTASQVEQKTTALSRAAALDPQFALPLINLAEIYSATGRPDEARAALSAALTRQLDPVEREQVALLSANLTQDSAQQAQALQRLAAAASSQGNVQVLTGNLLQGLHQTAPAITSYLRAVRIDPENAEVWNRLGYANAYLGRLPAAREALETFRKLEPDNANALDSLGEVHYLNGQFKSAAEYFQAAFAKSPQFEGGRSTLKAAYARLLDGQLDAADQAEAAYAKIAGKTPVAAVAHAHWLYSRGQPEAAVGYLTDAAATATGPTAAVFHTHRCGLLLRFSQSAGRTAAQAAARIAMSSGPAGPATVLCFFVSQPSATPAEWSSRAERAFPGPNAKTFRRQALAYALFFDRHYAEAFPLIEALAVDSSPDSDSELRVWLAECQWRTGRWTSARETLARWPLPAIDSIFSGRHVPDTVVAILKTGEHFDDNAVAKRWSPIGKTVLRAFD